MSHTFKQQGHTLAYETFGDPAAPPILLVHGWLSHRQVWRQTIPVLQQCYYCVALDLLGFGDSDKPADGDYSILAQAECVLALADRLGFSHFSLVGHSMGGQICLLLAARLVPKRVERLVSVAGVVTGKLMPMVERVTVPLVNLCALYPPLYKLAASMVRWKPYAHFVFRPWFYRMDAVPFESWEIDRRMALRPELSVSAQRAIQAIHSADLTADLLLITASTLAIFGRGDGTVPVSDGELVRSHIPNAQLSLIDACGHFPMYEQTSAYLDILTGFMK